MTGFDGTKSFNIHPLDPISLEEFIEEYCLLGFNTSSVIENCFLHPDHDVIEKIYTGKQEGVNPVSIRFLFISQI